LVCSCKIQQYPFSPDGNCLVSAGKDKFVSLWDYITTDGYYLQLQEWELSQELDDEVFELKGIDVSPCSRCVVVLLDMYILLKDVKNKGETIKSFVLPGNERGEQIKFSNIDGHRSIFIRTKNRYNNKEFVKIWRPYAVVDDNDPGNTAPLVTILEESNRSFVINDFALSHDNSMIAIYGNERNDCKVILYSVDNDNKSTTLKQSFSTCYTLIRFTPDDNYISYNNKNRSAFWDTTSGREISDQINITYNKNKDIRVASFSPADSGQRLLIFDQTANYRSFYIASFWEIKVQNNRKQQKRLK
jgi:WD40 repeat protein